MTSNDRAVEEAGLHRALGHPMRVQVLEILNERVASPTELARHLDVPLARLSYHIRLLAEEGWIELVDTVPRRGALEHYYSTAASVSRSELMLDDAAWKELEQACDALRAKAKKLEAAAAARRGRKRFRVELATVLHGASARDRSDGARGR